MTNEPDDRLNRTFWVMGLVFIGLMAVFVLDIWNPRLPARSPAPVNPDWAGGGPVREAVLAPYRRVGEDVFRCSDCHGVMEPAEVVKPFYSAHADIVLAHGMNNNCRTCHDRDDKDWLTNPLGEKVAFEQSERTCAVCHATQYRDWEQGLHGKVAGSWLDESTKTRLTCVQCHDPHQPAFPAMVPSPMPRTSYSGHPPVADQADRDRDAGGGQERTSADQTVP